METVIAAVVVALGLAAGLVIAARVLASRAPQLGVANGQPQTRPPAPHTEPSEGAAPPTGDAARAEKRLLAREEDA